MPQRAGCVPHPYRRALPELARIMTTFDKREEGFEKRFALDEEQKFKADARRNKLLGLWVAEQLWHLRRGGQRLRQEKWSPPISKRPAMATW